MQVQKIIMRWSETTTLEFVKIYLKHECLWNTAHPDYKHKYFRQKAYMSIMEEFKGSTNKTMSLLEVKVKIKNLRTTYTQQIHKILEKSNPEYIYEPSLVWFQEMDKCLKHVSTLRIPNSVHSSHENEEVDSSCQVWVDHLNDNTLADNHPDPLIAQSEDEFNCDNVEEMSRPIKQEHDSPIPKRSKKKKSKHKSPTREYLTDSTSDILKQVTDVKEDEFDVYGKFIASQLRSMGLRKALKLQLEIHSLISKSRMNDVGD